MFVERLLFNLLNSLRYRLFNTEENSKYISNPEYFIPIMQSISNLFGKSKFFFPDRIEIPTYQKTTEKSYFLNFVIYGFQIQLNKQSSNYAN